MNEFKDFLDKRVSVKSEPEKPVTEIQILTHTAPKKKQVRWHWVSENIIQKENRVIKFLANCKKTYNSHCKRLITYDLLYKLLNPLKIQGNVEIYHIFLDEGAIALTASFTSDKVYYELEIVRDANKLWGIDIIYISISDDLLQHGFFRNLFAASLPVWDKLKISMITTEVTGGYYANSCSKLGFDFFCKKERTKVKKEFYKFLELNDVVLRSKMLHSWDIAQVASSNYNGIYGNHIGKEFLIEYTQTTNKKTKRTNEWLGILDLEKCSPSRLQLERYIYNKVLPKSVKCLQGKTEKKLYKSMTPERQLHMMVRHTVAQHICTGNAFINKNMLTEAEEQFRIASDNVNKLKRQRKWKDLSLSQYLHSEIQIAISNVPEEYKSLIKS